jgi:glutamate-1-semialdehyde 2,1-aminomutase
MRSGRGCRVTDVDGVERLDFVNCNSAAIHGHQHPHVLDAVQRQATTLMCSGMPTEGEVRLAEMLCDRLPGVEQVRLANSGTEALMYAVRVARAVTGRSAVARVEGTYHGSYDSFYVSVRPSPEAWGPPTAPCSVPYSEGLPGTVVEDVLVLPFNDTATAQRLLEQHSDRIACIVVDPLPAFLGFLRASDEFLTMLRETATRCGMLLVFDEVFCFRLGPQGAQGFVGIDPDLTALGKVIGGGLPVGALGGKRQFMQLFDHSRGHARVEQSGTFSGNPMTVAAGIATLELLDASAFDRMSYLGQRLRDGLGTALRDAGVAGQARGEGSMNTLIFNDRDYANYREFVATMAAPGVLERAAWFHRFMLDQGVIFIPPGLFILSTPMTVADIDAVVQKAASGFQAIARGSEQSGVAHSG